MILFGSRFLMKSKEGEEVGGRFVTSFSSRGETQCRVKAAPISLRL